jgi:hypothetical protein
MTTKSKPTEEAVTACNCLNELEDPSIYGLLDGKKVESVCFTEASLTFNFTTGKSGRKIVLHQTVRLEGVKKARKVNFYPAFCCFCGKSFNGDKENQ